jgi:hypothetical protein
MISNLASREKLQVKLRYMRNGRHMKTRNIKSALANYRKRSTISSLNQHRRMKRAQRIKMSRILCHVKRSSRIKNPRWPVYGSWGDWAVAEETMDGSGGATQCSKWSIHLVSSRTHSGGYWEEEPHALAEVLEPSFRWEGCLRHCSMSWVLDL